MNLTLKYRTLRGKKNYKDFRGLSCRDCPWNHFERGNWKKNRWFWWSLWLSALWVMCLSQTCLRRDKSKGQVGSCMFSIFFLVYFLLILAADAIILHGCGLLVTKPLVYNPETTHSWRIVCLPVDVLFPTYFVITSGIITSMCRAKRAFKKTSKLCWFVEKSAYITKSTFGPYIFSPKTG